jgi:NADH-quinone oxidoreductase subunit M
LPILNGFVGEFLILSSSFGVHAGWAAAATVGVILSAAYMLWLVQRIFYGPVSSLVGGKGAPDLLFHEAIALWPAAVLMFIMGIASPLWIRAIDPTVGALVDTVPGAASSTARAPAISAQAAPSPSTVVTAEKQ